MTALVPALPNDNYNGDHLVPDGDPRSRRRRWRQQQQQQQQQQ